MRPCCDPPGGGWADRTAQRSQRSGEPEGEKNLLREEAAQRRGNCFRWKVAGMKPKAQPCPRQDSRQTRTYWCRPSPKGGMADSVPAHDGCTGTLSLQHPHGHPNGKAGNEHASRRIQRRSAWQPQEEDQRSRLQRDTFMSRPSLHPGIEPPPPKTASTSASGRAASHRAASASHSKPWRCMAWQSRIARLALPAAMY